MGLKPIKPWSRAGARAPVPKPLVDLSSKYTVLVKPSFIQVIGYTFVILLVGVLIGMGLGVWYQAERLASQANKLTYKVTQFSDQAHYLFEQNIKQEWDITELKKRLRRAEHLMHISIWERKKADEQVRTDDY